MNDSVKQPGRRGKISYRIPVGKEAEFDALVALSGLSTNGFLTDCIFRRNRHNPAQLKRLAEVLASVGALKTELKNQALLNDEVIRELTLIRTILMSLMERRS